MSEIKKIKKGLNINLKGKAEKVFIKAKPSETYAVKPIDFAGLMPKLSVVEGDEVKAGTTLFYSKSDSRIKFTAPMCGRVKEIIRGERRKIQEVIIEACDKIEYETFVKADPSSLDRKAIIENLLESGLWPSIKQRPYNIIANPDNTPKSIFISGIDSAPLGVDYDFLMQDCEKEFQVGVHALRKLTKGNVHLSINGKYPPVKAFKNVKNTEIHKFTGPHPVGNVGTQIHHIDPINKGEIVWTVEPQNVVMIGKLFLNGRYDARKIVALTGSEVYKPRYYKVISGCCITSLTEDNVRKGNQRYISGNVLTGKQIEPDGYLGFYDSSVTIIPEGNEYKFLGWLSPGFNKFSSSPSFLSRLIPNKEFTINSNLNGGRRALMITGQFEKVFPMDIYPMQLLKAIIIEDIDLMEKLGIYEVAEEDFALCEFVDTSKTEIQAIVRKGLDLMIKEMN